MVWDRRGQRSHGHGLGARLTGPQPEPWDSQVRDRLSTCRHRQPSGKGFPNRNCGHPGSWVGVGPPTRLDVGRSSGRTVIGPKGRMEHRVLLGTVDWAVTTSTSVSRRMARSSCSDKVSHRVARSTLTLILLQRAAVGSGGLAMKGGTPRGLPGPGDVSVLRCDGNAGEQGVVRARTQAALPASRIDIDGSAGRLPLDGWWCQRQGGVDGCVPEQDV
jgi:hypothetical protein